MIHRQWILILLLLILRPLVPLVLWIFGLIAMIGYFYEQKLDVWLLFFLGLLIIGQEMYQMSTVKVDRALVVYQQDNMHILMNGFNRFTVFDQSLSVGDYISFNPTVGTLSSGFESYGLLHHRYVLTEIQHIQILNQSRFYTNLSQLTSIRTKQVIYSLFGFYSTKNFSTSLQFMLSTGLLLSGFIHYLRRFLGYWLYPNHVDRCILVFCFLWMILVPISFSSLRIFLNALLKSRKLELLARHTFVYSLLLFIYPSAVKSLSFWFPFVLNFYSFLSSSRMTKSLRYHWLLFLQLHFLYAANILMILLFPLFQFLSVFLLLILLSSLVFSSFSNFFEIYVHFLERLDVGMLQIIGKPPLFLSLLWFVGLILHSEKRWYLKVILLLVLIFPKFDARTIVSFIDVQQGDASLIKLPHVQKGILIDTGKKNQAQSVLTEMNRLGIRSLEYVIISHFDEDHVGGLEVIQSQRLVKNLISQKGQSLTGYEDHFTELLSTHYFDNENDNSLIYLVTLQDLSFLYTGDISKSVERLLVEHYPQLKVDVIKLAHHGSKTSSDEFFLQQIQPHVAIISAQHRFYRHPSTDTLKTLYKIQLPYLNTEEQGTIRFYLTRFFNWIETDQTRIIWMR